MIILHNGCYCSDLKVHPSNWRTISADITKGWYIRYRFFDPAQKEKYPEGKQMQIRGMNRYTNLAERRAVTKVLLDNELDLLQCQGYNPITGGFYIPPDSNGLETFTPFIKALALASSKLKCVEKTMCDIRCVIRGTEVSAKKLGFNNIPIWDIKRKHIKLILEECQRTNSRFSAHRYNLYRAYLLMLFKELVELDAIPYNPVRDISKMKEIKKIRPTLTMDQRRMIDELLHRTNRPFWLFMQIFFHAGARITELLLLQGKDVDLQNQTFKTLIKKGGSREVCKTIKDVAIPFWTEAMRNCGPEDYLFSEGLVPGKEAIRADQMSRRWQTWVVKPLSRQDPPVTIKASLYSLKHSNTTEVVDRLSYEDAARMNSHTSTGMVVSIYDVHRQQREHDRLRKVNNSFS